MSRIKTVFYLFTALTDGEKRFNDDSMWECMALRAAFGF
jgi:hypothetical protein